MEIVIRKADTSESAVLTELTFKSKRYWGYPEEYMKIWEEDLTVTEEYIRKNIVYTAVVSDSITGYYSILYNPNDYLSRGTLVKKGYWLDNLFILPQYMKQGIGTTLIKHAINTCKNIGCEKLFVFSDPHSKEFYLKQGARFIQDCPSSIAGRTLPMLELDIDKGKMNFILETENMEEYLKSSEIIDYSNKSIKSAADSLFIGTSNEIELVEKAYEYVRDQVAHSFDIKGSIVTCKASDVLKHKQGVCYAKSHLLCAILRYLGIPSGFCYQKLLFSEVKPCIILHGLNGVYLKSIDRWIRVDARGNNEGVNAEFSIEEEHLAFPVKLQLGEADSLIIYSHPSKNVIQALSKSRTVDELIDNLPTEI